MNNNKEENYEFPTIELLNVENPKNKVEKSHFSELANKLQHVLNSFGISANVEKIIVGPSIITYQLKLAIGVSINKIRKLEVDIALSLGTKILKIEQVPNESLLGIEIERENKEIVEFGEVIKDEAFKNSTSNLTIALGKDIAGNNYIINLEETSHILISGTTGSGKSVCIHSIINSILYKAKSSDVKIIMIDPKVVELSVYNGIPHLLIPVVTDTKKAAGVLAWLVQEMENRYIAFATKGVKDLKGYNETVKEENNFGKLPSIVIIIDEFADLIEWDKETTENFLYRLTQRAKKVGIYIIIATERPSINIITGTIKANISTRIALEVFSQIDSKLIIDEVGAEKLFGKGDMLFSTIGNPKPIRIQGSYISEKQINNIINFLKNKDIIYNEEIIEKIEKANKSEIELEAEQNLDDEADPLLMDAIDVVVETGQASTSFIQRRFRVNYARAGRIIDQLEERGIISGYQGSKPREVLITPERLKQLKNN